VHSQNFPRDIALILDETYRDFITTGVPHRLSFARSGPAVHCHLSLLVIQELVHRDAQNRSQPRHRRPIQLALASILPSLRPFDRKNAEAMHSRHEHFKARLHSSRRIVHGRYFAFVRHTPGLREDGGRRFTFAAEATSTVVNVGLDSQ